MKTINRKNILILFLVCVSGLALNQIMRFVPGVRYPSTTVYKVFVCVTVVSLFLYMLGETKVSFSEFLFLIYAMYIIIVNLFNSISIIDAIVSSGWCLAFIVGNRVAQNGNENSLIGLKAVIFIIITLAATYAMYVNFSGIINARTNIIAVNYVIYFGLPVFLYASVNNLRKLEAIIMILWMGLAIFSFKRTTLIAVAGGLVTYIYYKYLKSRNAKDKFRFFLIVAVLSIVAIFVNKYTGGYIVQRLQLIQETGGNGRAGIWEDVFALFNSQSFMGKMIGNGYNSVNYLYGISAHNEFLETLVDYGVVGGVFFIAIIIMLLKKARYCQKNSCENGPIYLFTIVVIFVMSLFSHIQLYPYVAIPVFYFFGLLYGMNDERIGE